MRKKVTRTIEVCFCDICDKETSFLVKCPICSREFCESDTEAHKAYVIDGYRYSDRKHFKIPICKDCSKKKITGTLKEILNAMIEGKAISFLVP